MANSLANLRHRHSEKARHLLRRSGYKAGGAVSDDAEDKKLVKKGVRQHEANDHKGEKPTALKLKDGGGADGPSSYHHRLDRKGRAEGGRTRGKKKGHPTVNVIIAGGHGDQPPPRPVPVPVPMGGPPPGGAPPMAPHPPMPPPGAAGPGAGMPPPGMPPRPMANRGGRIAKERGGSLAAPFRSNPDAPDEAPKERIKRAIGDGYDRFKKWVSPEPEVSPAKAPTAPETKPEPEAVPEKRGGRAKREDGGAATASGADRGGNRRSGAYVAKKIGDMISGTNSGASAATTPEQPPKTPPAGPATGEKRGGRAKRADGGRLSPDKLDTASPLDYDGSDKNANSIRSSKKNNGSSNEGDRQAKSWGGPAMKLPHHAGGGGLGRMEKAKLYGGHRDNKRA